LLLTLRDANEDLLFKRIQRVLPRIAEKMEAQRHERQERREQGKTPPQDNGYCTMHEVQMRRSKDGDGWYHKAGEKPDGKAIWCRGK
jgi:hypothetical protein